MSRSMFGWSLPPGCTNRHIEEAFEEGPCQCCGKLIDSCICQECPTCGSQGDPRCYEVHGLKFTRQQLIGQITTQIGLKRQQLDEDAEQMMLLAQILEGYKRR